ncbi:NAD(P)/FAD-dependent oxidoreductase [Paenibacillus flagellatus]|uniref:NAD(P)/FAD-dependent oxidoreductase n=1 Tax=Paenibacillus flagellatus TaxID=2211139 RepID=A0A2V5KPR6_9BACL|nr:NAD(P)/FAD-dependent oxidoreductase [Paenibacillus flagellatus]PYI50526.1 NAD(P)/FAD-dependent oxidoreductase [Paenibacillus flagellatus]
MIFDCVIVGGGPAGLNAALVLGRARRNVALIDDNNPRNAVTRESHGFITRDGIEPSEFRHIAHGEIARYPSVRVVRDKVLDAVRNGRHFELTAESGETFQARTIILATGLKEILPPVEGIRAFYGKSLFNCPYCDGWELRDRRLVVISENEHAFHMAKTVSNWTNDLFVATNGHRVLTEEQRNALAARGIAVEERKIASLAGENGQLATIVFEDGTERACTGGFVTPQLVQPSRIGESLGCRTNPRGGYIADELGRTNIAGVYAAGDSSFSGPSQLILAAAGGFRAAAGVNADLIDERWAD